MGIGHWQYWQGVGRSIGALGRGNLLSHGVRGWQGHRSLVLALEVRQGVVTQEAGQRLERSRQLLGGGVCAEDFLHEAPQLGEGRAVRAAPGEVAALVRLRVALGTRRVVGELDEVEQLARLAWLGLGLGLG